MESVPGSPLVLEETTQAKSTTAVREEPAARGHAADNALGWRDAPHACHDRDDPGADSVGGAQGGRRRVADRSPGAGGPRYARGDAHPEVVRWGAQPGSIYLADQQLPILAPRVRVRVRDRRAGGEVALQTYAALQALRAQDEGSSEKSWTGSRAGSTRRATSATEATPWLAAMHAVTMSRALGRCPHSPDASQRDLLVAYVRMAQQIAQPLTEIIGSGNDHVRDDAAYREMHDFLHDIRPERQIDAYRHRRRVSMECSERAQGGVVLGICDFQKNSGRLSARHAVGKAGGTRDEVHGHLGGKGAADRLLVALVRE